MLLAAWCAAREPSYPVDVEVDLIFPRPGGTYKRIYPFPIIYVVRNAAAVWPFEFAFIVSIQGGEPDEIVQQAYLPPFEGEGPGSTSYIHSRGELPADQDPFYAILPFDDVVNATQTDKVRVDLLLTVLNCAVPPTAEFPKVGGYRAEGNFTFNLSDDGELPDAVLSRDECPVPLYAFRLLGEGGSYSCVVVDEKPVEPDPCGLQTTATLKTKVVEEMLSEAGCREGTPWPDEEKKGRCPAEEGEEDIAGLLRGSLPGVIAAVTAGVFFLS